MPIGQEDVGKYGYNFYLVTQVTDEDGTREFPVSMTNEGYYTVSDDELDEVVQNFLDYIAAYPATQSVVASRYRSTSNQITVTE